MRHPTIPHVTLLLLAVALLRAEPAAEVAQFAGQLESPNLRERRAAAEKLGRTGEPAAAAVPALIKALADPDDLVRRNAAWALGKIQTPHDRVVAALVAKLHEENEDWSVRHNTALSLSWIGAPAVPPLRRSLDAKPEWTRAYSADALIRIGGEQTSVVVPVVGDLLTSRNVEVRAFAATLAGRLAHQAEPLAAKLAALLDEKELQPRIHAIKALVELGPAARAALPRVKIALRDDTDQWVRIGAVQVLAQSALDETETIQLLVETFADAKDRVGGYSVQSVARFNEAAVPALLAALKSEKTRVRLRAAEALAFIGNGAGKSCAEASSALAQVLAAERDWEVRSLAAAAIGALGTASPEVVATLRGALRDEHEIVRLNAGEALKKLGHAVPTSPPPKPRQT